MRAVAYRLQEIAHGGASKVTQRRLMTLTAEFETGGRIAPPPGPKIKPGSRLVREWHGRTHTVCVTDVGFEFQGPLHLVVRETEFCGQRLAGDFSRRMRENGRNSVRRPRHASLTDRNCEGFCRPGNRVGLPVLYGGGRSPAEPVSTPKIPC